MFPDATGLDQKPAKTWAASTIGLSSIRTATARTAHLRPEQLTEQEGDAALLERFLAPMRARSGRVRTQGEARQHATAERLALCGPCQWLQRLGPAAHSGRKYIFKYCPESNIAIC